MWMVEAKTFGDDPEYLRYGPLTEEQSKAIHKDLADSGEWAMVRSWCLDQARKQKESDARILAWAKEIEDGIGEGQPL
jgi:hypothetical protein